jgi:hypothetical protein
MNDAIGTGGVNLTVGNPYFIGYMGRYNSSGYVKWAINVDGASSIRIWTVTVDKNGNGIGAGFFSVSVNCRSRDGTLIKTLSSNSSIDAFIISTSQNGSVNWCTRVGGLGDEGIYALATDSQNNVFALGGSSSALVYIHNADGSLASSMTSAASASRFLIKYSPAGVVLWTVIFT